MTVIEPLFWVSVSYFGRVGRYFRCVGVGGALFWVGGVGWGIILGGWGWVNGGALFDNAWCQLQFWYDKSLHAWNDTPSSHMVEDEIFLYIICWWQFECHEACTPESVTIFGWEVDIKYMQNLEFSSICVASFIIWER